MKQGDVFTINSRDVQGYYARYGLLCNRESELEDLNAGVYCVLMETEQEFKVGEVFSVGTMQAFAQKHLYFVPKSLLEGKEILFSLPLDEGTEVEGERIDVVASGRL